MRDIRAQLVDKSQPLDFALMVGDQVYVDGTAGQFDPTGGDYYRFREVYREAWTSYAQSEVMRRIPCYFMFDDHEVYDNWSPPDPGDPFVNKKSAVDWRRDQDQKVGLDYAWRYQLQAGPLSVLPHPPLAPQCWYPFSTHGQHFFVCDTRSERKETRATDRRGARIMGDRQVMELYVWLAMQQNADRSSMKFVVSPVPMFPMGSGSAVSSDAWARFPESRDEFFDFVVAMEITNVVILSGDAHCFLDATIVITKANKFATIRNITTAGLYAPYPFANSQPEDFLVTANDAILVGPNTGTAWSYEVTESASSIGGWTLIGFDENGALTVEFRDTVQMPAVSQFVARER